MREVLQERNVVIEERRNAHRQSNSHGTPENRAILTAAAFAAHPLSPSYRGLDCPT